MTGFLIVIDFAFSFSQLKNGLQIVWANVGKTFYSDVFVFYVPFGQAQSSKE